MAEGMTRLNRQVVETGHWNLTDRIAPFSDHPQPTGSNQGERERRLEDIRHAVEADILPRVLLGREKAADAPVEASNESKIGNAEVIRFVRILLSHSDEAAVSGHVMAIQARGFPIDQIYLHLFQEAARYIGELWCDDICSFVDVTLAIGTMQKLMRRLGPEFHKNGRPAEGARQALLIPLPGDQHTFGLSMVTEFFRRSGWSVWSAPFRSAEELGEAVRKGWYTVVGFSAGGESRLDELAAAIRVVRRESCNAAVGILVGGPVFLDRPDHVARVGADAVGHDATQALDRAESFVALATGP